MSGKFRIFITLLCSMYFVHLITSANTYQSEEREYWDFETFGFPAEEFYGNVWNQVKVKSPEVDRAKLFWGFDLSLENDTSKYAHPVFGDITSNFGDRPSGFHYGMDMRLEEQDPVYAAFDGVVRVVANQPSGYGNVLVVRHFNGLETLYAHLHGAPLVKPNQIVKSGQVMAYGGNTGRSSGKHLHFETIFLGKPFDPNKIIDFETYQLKENIVNIDASWFHW